MEARPWKGFIGVHAVPTGIPKRMNMRDIQRGIMGVAAAAVLAAGIVGCAGSDGTDVAEASEPNRRLVSVEVAEVQAASFADFVQIVGRIEADHDVTISAEESGTIRELLVEKGGFVQEGQPIARIDDSVLRPQSEQAAAEATLAQETWERQRRLWEEDRVGSEINYLQARYQAETAAAGARALQERLDRTVVRAPISGVLDDRLVEVGTLVSPGTPIGRILDTRTVKVAGGVPERYAGQIETGSEVQIGIEGAVGVSFTGEVNFVGAAVDQENRSFPIELHVPNEDGRLKPGMVVNVRVLRETVAEALVIPQEAVLREEDGYAVFVAIDRGGELFAESRPVALGPSQGNQVMIDEGLDVGDQVIVVGQTRLATGDQLQIVQATAGRL
ncbi:MAG: efflux RND transporter periplasmic adaptor subunit [Gemmatimonas sp.]|nr:efflux RND transporter periplasmic adaptor subunit [Gemmatimonas sp.]